MEEIAGDAQGRIAEDAVVHKIYEFANSRGTIHMHAVNFEKNGTQTSNNGIKKADGNGAKQDE